MLHSANASATLSRKKCHSSHCWCALDCFSLSRGEWTVQMLQLACNMVGDRRVSWKWCHHPPKHCSIQLQRSSKVNVECGNYPRSIGSGDKKWPRQVKGPPTVSLSKTASWIAFFSGFFSLQKIWSKFPLSAMFLGTHAISATVPIVDLSVFRWKQPIYQDLGLSLCREECRKDFAFKQSNASRHAIATYSNDCINMRNRIIQGEGERTCVHTHL